MPRQPQRNEMGVPQSAKTPMVIPTREFPHFERLMDEIDYKCTECTNLNQGVDVYHTLNESSLSPISGVCIPGRKGIGSKGIIATRFLVMCPKTQFVPVNSPLFERAVCDLERFTAAFKKPDRGVRGRSGVSFDDKNAEDYEAEKVETAASDYEPKKGAGKQTKKFGSSRLKKTSDLKTAPVAAAEKPRKLTAKEKKLVALALASNQTVVGEAGIRR